jgi:hypothetical protein
MAERLLLLVDVLDPRLSVVDRPRINAERRPPGARFGEDGVWTSTFDSERAVGVVGVVGVVIDSGMGGTRHPMKMKW